LRQHYGGELYGSITVPLRKHSIETIDELFAAQSVGQIKLIYPEYMTYAMNQIYSLKVTGNKRELIYSSENKLINTKPFILK